MTYKEVEAFIIAICYISFFAGNFLLVSDIASSFYKQIKAFIAERRNKIKLSKPKNKFDSRLDYLLKANNIELTTSEFKSISFLIFFVTFLVLVKNGVFIGIALLLGIILMPVPFFYLRIRLLSIQNTASHEAETLLSELIIKYRISNFNIQTALEEVYKVKRLTKSRVAILRLLILLKSTRNEDEIKEAINVFSYTIGTNWAKILAANIYQANVYDINVMLGLEDIMQSLRYARKNVEKQKRDMAETKRMLYSIPILYAFLFFVSIKYAEVPLVDYINNQFFSSQGILLITLIIAGFIFSIMSMIAVKKKKFDI